MCSSVKISAESLQVDNLFMMPLAYQWDYFFDDELDDMQHNLCIIKYKKIHLSTQGSSCVCTQSMKMMLQCNPISHRLDACTKWSLSIKWWLLIPPQQLSLIFTRCNKEYEVKSCVDNSWCSICVDWACWQLSWTKYWLSSCKQLAGINWHCNSKPR